VVLSLSAAVAVPFIITGNAPDLLGSGDNESRGPTPALSPSFGASLPYITAAATTPPASPSVTPTPTPVAPPGAPGALETGGATTNSVNLSWTASSGTVTQYLIERCQGSGCSNFVQIATATATTHTADGLSSGTTYRFRVRAENGGGQSAYSTIVTASTMFSAILEAESGTRSGCAVLSNFSGASGGQIVDRIGHQDDWTGCSNGNGVLTYTNVNLPAGTFTITIYHVFAQQSGDPSRFARLRLDPTAAGSNIDFDRSYPRTTTIQGWTTNSFTLSAAGTYTITFSNPGVSGQDRSPAVDRIVIQQTS
jgi:hypothetical protein